jgi:GDP-mannose pyrophosphatase NudK
MIEIKKEEVLSNNWYLLKKITFEQFLATGSYQTQSREVYDRGNGAAIFLFNKLNKKILLTRQFRLPTYLNGNDSGFLIEVCAGLLENESPESCIIRETEEETGYRLKNVEKIFEAYMSPGAVTEIIHFFKGEYDLEMKVHNGGGREEEQENIEVMEIDFSQAIEMMQTGTIKDAKTIMLLQYAQLHNLLS